MMLRASEKPTGNDFINSQIKRQEEEAQANSRLNNELDKNAFLELLMAEVKYQDPLEPMNDREMISQLAGFSELEQMENMNSKFDNLLNSQNNQLWSTAANFLGKKAVAMVTEDGQLTEGTVTKATIVDGQLQLEINQIPVTLDQIVGVMTDGTTVTEVPVQQ